mmetsp:Transcript_19392/g.42999  ORF Transcript_19392/g.42999 Transcript_19392/m.42999 type:complete len:604 (+) Transcript_19392:65-1876(+)
MGCFPSKAAQHNSLECGFTSDTSGSQIPTVAVPTTGDPTCPPSVATRGSPAPCPSVSEPSATPGKSAATPATERSSPTPGREEPGTEQAATSEDKKSTATGGTEKQQTTDEAAANVTLDRLCLDHVNLDELTDDDDNDGHGADPATRQCPRPSYVPEYLSGLFQQQSASAHHVSIRGRYAYRDDGVLLVLWKAGDAIELRPLGWKLKSGNDQRVVWATDAAGAEVTWSRVEWCSLPFEAALRLGATLKQLQVSHPLDAASLSVQLPAGWSLQRASGSEILWAVQGVWIRSSSKHCFVTGAVVTFEDGTTRRVQYKAGYAELNGWTLVSVGKDASGSVMLTWEMGNTRRDWLCQNDLVPFDVALRVGCPAEVLHESLVRIGESKWKCGIPRGLPDHLRHQARAVLEDQIGPEVLAAVEAESNGEVKLGSRVVLASQAKKFDGILSPTRNVQFPVGIVERIDQSDQPYLVRLEGSLPTAILGSTWYFSGDLALAADRAASLRVEARRKRDVLRDFHACDRAFCTALAVTPLDGDLWQELVQTRLSEGLLSSAIDALKRATQFIPSSPAIRQRLKELVAEQRSLQEVTPPRINGSNAGSPRVGTSL